MFHSHDLTQRLRDKQVPHELQATINLPQLIGNNDMLPALNRCKMRGKKKNTQMSRETVYHTIRITVDIKLVYS